MNGCHVVGMTALIRTITLAMALAMAGVLAGCTKSGIPQDDRYQPHGNASWENWRG
jgi:hypothetical protein